jgi:hypothetical protein
MTQGTSRDVTAELPCEAGAPASRLILGGGRFWLALAAAAVVAGAAFNWSWLVAVGVAPLLLTLLPCAAMCALHLCASRGAGGGCTDQNQQASGRAAAGRGPSQ